MLTLFITGASARGEAHCISDALSSATHSDVCGLSGRLAADVHVLGLAALPHATPARAMGIQLQADSGALHCLLHLICLSDHVLLQLPTWFVPTN